MSSTSPRGRRGWTQVRSLTRRRAPWAATLVLAVAAASAVPVARAEDLPTPPVRDAGVVEDAGGVAFAGEAGGLLGISAASGAAVIAGAARYGTGGLAVTATAAPGFARWNADVLPQGHTHASARLWFRVLDRASGESVDLFTIQNSRRTENFDFFVNGVTGRLQWDLYRGDTDGVDTPLVVGRWYLFEAQVEFEGSQYTATVRLDGVPQGTIASTYPATTIRSVWVGAETAKTHTQHYDDLAVRVGDAPAGWLTSRPPQVDLAAPAENGIYGRGETVTADLDCREGDFALTSCLATVEDGSAVDTGSLGEHEFTVTATDVTGQASSVTHHYTVVDETAPTVDLVSPVDAAVYAPGAVVFADYGCADDPGGSGLSEAGSCVAPVADGAPIDTSVPGTHDFTVTATDAAGNASSVTHTYSVADGRAPLVDLRSPAEGATFGRGETVVAGYDCADEDGGSGLAVDGCVGPVPDATVLDTTALGIHEFTVTATDSAGNVASVTHTYTVEDRTEPAVELRRPADGAVVGRGEIVEADFACADEDGGSGLAPLGGCAGTAPSGTPIDTSVLGAHEFTVTATDGAGNSTAVTHGYTVVDRTSPAVDLRSPADGAVVARGASVPADFECFDEIGGGGLRDRGSCLGPVAVGAPVDTWTLGDHSFTVTANDAAGNIGSVTHTYTVLDNQPDLMIREGSAERFAGADVYNGTGVGQTRDARVGRRVSATFVVRVQNDTGARDRFRIRGDGADRRWTVRYLDGRRDVTGAVTRGTYRIGPLAPGRSAELRLVVHPRASAPAGARHAVRVTSSASNRGHAQDTVAARLRLV